MDSLLYIIGATAGISLLSFSGSFLLFFKHAVLEKVSLFLVALAAGALLGTAILHLLPEALEQGFPPESLFVVLIGFCVFYMGEKLMHLHHGAEGKGEHGPRSLGALSLLGDGLHNFVDGVVLAAAFLVDIKLGLVTTAAVALHEVPQEIAEFGVLLYSGLSKRRALLLNFLSATTVILGGVFGFFAHGLYASFVPAVLAFATGTFLYIGASGFIPEVKEERHPGKTAGLFLVFVSGLLLMWLFAGLE
ncbi:MAG: ZIP family metal transporter [Candidatus Wildermuthbacteria bacterium]|nr:ZIP family metal transporter [Candidatus Wildermuthbacteria bacterium]